MQKQIAVKPSRPIQSRSLEEDTLPLQDHSAVMVEQPQDAKQVVKFTCGDCNRKGMMEFASSENIDETLKQSLLADYLCIDCSWVRINTVKTEPGFLCGICLQDNIKVEELEVVQQTNAEIERSKNPCSHFFCRICLGRYVQIKLQTQLNPNQLTVECPEPGCGQQLPREQVRAMLTADADKKLFDRLNLLSKTPEFTQETVQYDKEHKYYVVCPTCAYGHYQTYLKDFQCWNCEVRRCSVCLNADHSSNNCLETQQTFADIKFQELLDLRQVQRCPHCKCPVQKNGGCNSIVCFSPWCKGNNSFIFAAPLVAEAASAQDQQQLG